MSRLAAEPSATLVLDTNVVLDLWLFADVRVRPLRDALQAGRVQAVVTPATLGELADVLRRDMLRAWTVKVAPDTVLGALQACSREVESPRPHPSSPRCTDPDDQKFIDLALDLPAAWLLSRDRAVLRLARAARSRGLRIGTPEQWAAQAFG